MLCHSYPQRDDILYLEPFRLIRTCSTATTPFEQVQALACASFFALTSDAQTPSASVILHTGTRSGGNIYGMLLNDNSIGERRYAFAFRCAPMDEKRRQNSSDLADLARTHQHGRCDLRRDPTPPIAHTARTDRPLRSRQERVRLDRPISRRSSRSPFRSEERAGRLGLVSCSA